MLVRPDMEVLIDTDAARRPVHVAVEYVDIALRRVTEAGRGGEDRVERRVEIRRRCAHRPEDAGHRGLLLARTRELGQGVPARWRFFHHPPRADAKGGGPRRGHRSGTCGAYFRAK